MTWKRLRPNKRSSERRRMNRPGARKPWNKGRKPSTRCSPWNGVFLRKRTRQAQGKHQEPDAHSRGKKSAQGQRPGRQNRRRSLSGIGSTAISPPWKLLPQYAEVERLEQELQNGKTVRDAYGSTGQAGRGTIESSGAEGAAQPGAGAPQGSRRRASHWPAGS